MDRVTAVGLVLSIIAAVFVWIIQPGYTHVARLRATIAETNKRMAEDHAWLKDYSQREVDARRHEQQLDVADMAGPPPKVEAAFYRSLGTMLAKHHVVLTEPLKITGYAPVVLPASLDGDTPASLDGNTPAHHRHATLESAPVTAELSGQYSDLAAMLMDLSRMPVLVGIDKAEFQNKLDASEKPRVALTLTAHLYVLESPHANATQ